MNKNIKKYSVQILLLIVFLISHQTSFATLGSPEPLDQEIDQDIEQGFEQVEEPEGLMKGQLFENTKGVNKFKSKKYVELKQSVTDVFNKILKYKKIELKSNIPIPEVIMTSGVSLKQFQDDVEQQWKSRPNYKSNVFVIRLNKIYLLNDKSYYERIKRCIEDSLAHELTHYIQVKYQGWTDLSDDSAEIDAVDVQRWFRKEHCD